MVSVGIELYNMKWSSPNTIVWDKKENFGSCDAPQNWVTFKKLQVTSCYSLKAVIDWE